MHQCSDNHATLYAATEQYTRLTSQLAWFEQSCPIFKISNIQIHVLSLLLHMYLDVHMYLVLLLLQNSACKKSSKKILIMCCNLICVSILRSAKQ